MAEHGPFLPPEPPGPEPELGGRPARPAAPPPPPVAAPAPAWGQAPPAVQPDNGQAVAGFVLSLVSVALLFLSAGLSSLVSVGCAIAGIVLSRRGKLRVQAGETTRSEGLAQAGFIIGIVGLVLSVLATAFWVLILIAALTDESFRDDLEREFDSSESISAALTVARAGARLLVG